MIIPASEPSVPSAADVEAASNGLRLLVPALAHVNGTVELRLGEADGANAPVNIPTPAFHLLLNILSRMAAGQAVRLIPYPSVLTTQEGAELTNVSHSYFVRLVDEGTVPSHLEDGYRRVLLADVLAYREEHRRAGRASLARMAAIDQELGLI